MHKIIFERLDHNEDIEVPRYMTAGAACLDLKACLTRTLYEVKNQSKKPFSIDLTKDLSRNYDAELPKKNDLDVANRLYINPGEVILIPTGFKVAFPDSLVMKLYIRSSVGISGLYLANGVGIVDSDYRGEIFLAVGNRSSVCRTINHGDRIAQASFEPIIKVEIEIGSVDNTERSAGGFGSTGVA